MQNYNTVISVLPLKMGNADIILGVQWLETLSEVKTNWKEQRMRFEHNGVTVTLQGDPTLCNGPVSLKSLWKAIKDYGEGIVVEYGGLHAREWDHEIELSLELMVIVSEFDAIFGEPQGLHRRGARSTRLP